MSSSNRIHNVVDVDNLFSSSDDEVDENDATDALEHPPRRADWSELSPTAQEKDLQEFRKKIKSKYNTERRRNQRFSLQEDLYDWNLLSRRTEQVITNLALSMGTVISSRQSF